MTQNSDEHTWGDNMSLMSSIYLGVSGLQASNNALNTVAHNLANLDTDGYTRQQVSLSTSNYVILSKTASATEYLETGLGVQYSEVRQVRDYFLDKTYREEYGREAFYSVSSDALTYIEDLLNENDDDNGFSEALSDLWSTIEELANDPSSSVTQGLFVSAAETLLERAASVYDSICEYQDNLNTQVTSYVDQINDYGERLAELNVQIAKIESAGVENANDLRDERNSILDALSQLCKISYAEDSDGYVSVQIEGADFVKRNSCYEIAVYTDSNGFYTPYWAADATVDASGNIDITGAEVFDLTQEISSDADTDIGELKSILLARGDHYADASDLADATTYENEIASSICMNVEAEFDNLISNIVTAINTILGNAGYTDGTSNTDNLLFVRTDDTEGWNISNISVNSIYLQTPSTLSFMLEDGSVDYDTTTALKDAFEAEDYILNPTLTQKNNFTDYYTNLVEQVTNSSSVAQSVYEAQETTVESAENARDQVLSVSSDEELQYMILYQNAYNAASRYITTVNDMLESIITAFGA